MGSDFEEYERHLREMLATLPREYMKAAEPYVKRLTEAYAMRLDRPAIIAVDPAQPGSDRTVVGYIDDRGRFFYMGDPQAGPPMHKVYRDE